jgi:hypothetical protein
MTVGTFETLIPYVVILLAVVLTVITARLGRRLRLRTPGGYRALPLAIQEAVEAGEAVHISLGSGAVQENTALSAVAGIAIARYAAVKALNSDHPPIVTTSEPVTLALAQDSLRQAYKARGRQNSYRPSLAQWLPQGRGSVTFAAGTGIALTEDFVQTNVLVGQFGSELAIVAEAAQRDNQQIIAQSDRLEGQAIAYAMSGTALIGEELYVADAFLAGTPSDIGSALALDVLRYAVIALILIGALVSLFGGNR